MARTYVHKGGDTAGIGIDGAELNREISRVLNELSQYAKNIDARDLGALQRNAMRLTRDAMRSEITDSTETIKVYRNGGLYAEIEPGTLKRSIGIGKSKTNGPARLFSAYWVGPRVKGAFKDPEKGGWFAHFINYGNIKSGNYAGSNRGFADRAKSRTMPLVLAQFTANAKAYLEREFNNVVK
jgi:hypothetical protein